MASPSVGSTKIRFEWGHFLLLMMVSVTGPFILGVMCVPNYNGIGYEERFLLLLSTHLIVVQRTLSLEDREDKGGGGERQR